MQNGTRQALSFGDHGGVTMVQLREKEGDPHLIKQKAIALKKILTPLNIPLIINDFVDIAAEVDADGVHHYDDRWKPIKITSECL